MSILRLDRLYEFLTSIQLVMALLWLGLAIFTVGLAILLYTRWGQYKPLRKCMAMSLLAHLLLAGYAATIQFVGPKATPEQILTVILGDGPDENAPPGGSASATSTVKNQPWEVFPDDPVELPEDAGLQREEAERPTEPQRIARADDAKLLSDPAVEHLALTEVKLPKSKPVSAIEAAEQSVPGEVATAIDAPSAQRREASIPGTSTASAPPDRLASELSDEPARMPSSDIPAALLHQIVPLPQMSEADALNSLPRATMRVGRRRARHVDTLADIANDDRGIAATPSVAGSTGKASDGGENGPIGARLTGSSGREAGLASASNNPPLVPDAYRLRVAPNREAVAQSHGGTSETEAAVKAALRWLADNQSADGRWDPRLHAAGNETNVAGRNRQNAGSRADAAMTGLALLAFLGSGHTHLEGPYRADVRRGLEFLMRSQAADGNLGGQAAVFEFMYCHAMAACALSEAYGMTRDERLRESVRRAIGYTVATQDPKGGGWRYRPGDSGDTSQLGWQLMSLKSAELAGIPMPEQTRQGIVRYLQSVSSGKHGGRASYRPGEASTRTMSAEALVCWQFLGLAREHPACNETGDYLMSELPGEGAYNLYYWYYATLGMYQLQDSHWDRWNQSLRAALVRRQVKDGPHAGSWATDDLWGGHGGRVYTTALATLTLEVYYRFLPLYTVVSRDGTRLK